MRCVLLLCAAWAALSLWATTASATEPTAAPASSTAPQTTPSAATPSAALLHEADLALQSGDPDLALKHLEGVRGPLSHAQVVEHRRLLGTARAFVDDNDGAVAAFIELVRYEPTFAFPYTASPKVTFAFELARASERKRRPLSVDVLTPPVARLDEPISISVRVQGDRDRRLQRVRLLRSDNVNGDAPPQEALLRDDVATFVLPGQSRDQVIVDDDGLPGVVLSMSAQGLDDEGSALVTSTPVVLPVGFDAPPPWWQSPALVAAGATVGVLIAGAVTAGLIIASLPPDVVDAELVVRR
jgi:hypothetical protein